MTMKPDTTASRPAPAEPMQRIALSTALDRAANHIQQALGIAHDLGDSATVVACHEILQRIEGVDRGN